MIKIEVAYATPQNQYLIELEVVAGCTIETAIRCSGIMNIFPEIDLKHQQIGVFSKLRSLSDVVSEGERIEIYRPLMIDPKAARRKKATSRKV